MQPIEVPEPWRTFLNDLDAQLTETVELHCLGGFVVLMQYHLEHQTSDIDFLATVPGNATRYLLELAGQDSPLHKKYRLYLQHVGIVNLPDGYDTRLVEMFPSRYRHLRLLALDPYDLALSKLERNAGRDRDDVRQLAIRVPLDIQRLRQRYEDEMRPNLANPNREDRTMDLWADMIEEIRKSDSS